MTDVERERRSIALEAVDRWRIASSVGEDEARGRCRRRSRAFAADAADDDEACGTGGVRASGPRLSRAWLSRLSLRVESDGRHTDRGSKRAGQLHDCGILEP